MLSRWRPLRHFTQKSAAFCWVHMHMQHRQPATSCIFCLQFLIHSTLSFCNIDFKGTTAWKSILFKEHYRWQMSKRQTTGELAEQHHSLPGLIWDYNTFCAQQRTEQKEGGSSTVRSTFGLRKTEDKTRQGKTKFFLEFFLYSSLSGFFEFFSLFFLLCATLNFQYLCAKFVSYRIVSQILAGPVKVCFCTWKWEGSQTVEQ